VPTTSYPDVTPDIPADVKVDAGLKHASARHHRCQWSNLCSTSWPDEPGGGQVSVTEHGVPGPPGAYDAPPDQEGWGDGPAAFAPGEQPRRPGDRTPPQDNAAEQSVLGSMLLSKDAIADVTEVVRGVDFYRPAHELIHDAVIDLYGRGEPADPVTVAAELQRRGELQRVGGAPYLHTLSANVPIAANAGYYAEIVREKAILRRLVDAGTKIVQIGYAGEGQVDDVVDAAQAEVYQVTDRRAAEDYAPLSDIMDGVLDEIEAIGNREAGLYGVPTGFADLDDLTNGLHSGQMVIVAARPAMGKALALDTPLPTPEGWTTMGEVAVGDLLYDAAGRPTRVVAATEVMHDRPCYQVSFSDGAVIVADAQHQWLTETRAARKAKWAAESHHNRARNQNVRASVVTTEKIASTVRINKDQRANHAVLNAQAIQGHDAELPIAPYVLGAWLGDGHSASARITCETSEIPMYIEGCGYEVSSRGGMLYSIRLPRRRAAGHECPDCGRRMYGSSRCSECQADHGSFTALLRGLGVLNNKHVPILYLRASQEARRELLAGLMDTDGTVVRGVGSCQFAVTNRALADTVHELVVSLGYKCGRTTKAVAGRSDRTSTCYILNFSTTDDVFRLQRKHLLHKEERPATTARIGRRYITDVQRVESVPVRCVQVDNDEHLYLAGRSMIPTHNSTLALDLCRAASIQNNLTSVFFSLEMTRSEITMRLLSAEARVPLNAIRNGNMSDDDWTKLARKMGEVSSAPMFIDDSPNMTMMEIRAKARRLKQRHDLRLVVIDYMQLMTSGKKVESRQLEVSEFSRQIKLLAKELEVPIIALSQLNRGPEQRGDKRPMMSDLRESGSLEQDADMVILLHRDDVYEKESTRPGEADLIVAKHRNGPTRDITVAFQGHYSRFVDMAH
jgi:replicative DNA helicase